MAAAALKVTMREHIAANEYAEFCQAKGIDVPAAANHAQLQNLTGCCTLFAMPDIRSMLAARGEAVAPNMPLVDLVARVIASAPQAAPAVAAAAAPPAAAGGGAPPAAAPAGGAAVGVLPAGQNDPNFLLEWDQHGLSWPTFEPKPLCAELFLLMPTVSTCTCFLLSLNAKVTALSMKQLKDIDNVIRPFRVWPQTADFGLSRSEVFEEIRHMADDIQSMTAPQLDSLKLNSRLRSVTSVQGARYFMDVDLMRVSALKKELNHDLSALNISCVTSLVRGAAHMSHDKKLDNVLRALVALDVITVSEIDEVARTFVTLRCSFKGLTTCVGSWAVRQDKHTKAELRSQADCFAKYIDEKLQNFAGEREAAPAGGSGGSGNGQPNNRANKKNKKPWQRANGGKDGQRGGKGSHGNAKGKGKKGNNKGGKKGNGKSNDGGAGAPTSAPAA